ncbi:MAG TPA: hypothetical protein VK092_01585, partial [Deinococcales bacterium]|nr:hypothetical protein [Deinococcales bacterium]
GVLTDVALSVTRSLEHWIRSLDTDELALEDLTDRIAELLTERVSPEVAERFRRQTPPFVPLLISVPDGVEPFSASRITRSLEALGLSFRAAAGTARQVEQILRTQGREKVAANVVSHYVALALEADFGRDLRARFEGGLTRPAEIEVAEPGGAVLPFSRGVMSRSMMAVGLGPETAYRLASRLESDLWDRQEHTVARSRLRELITRALREESGEQFADRYDQLHSFKLSGRPTIVLVGGAPGVGKSTIAGELAYRLGIGRLVSTDSVREALRSLISPELSPVLHASTFTAWKAELLPEESDGLHPNPKRVIRGFMSQVRMLDRAVDGIINRTLSEASSLVLEGVHLVPGASMAEGAGGDAQVIRLLLAVEDEESHRDHFAVRERQTASKRMEETYMKHFR